MNYMIEAIKYVTTDPYFLISMAYVTMTGIFLGALLYDGLLTEAKKGLVVIGSYSLLLMSTNASRILPIIFSGEVHDVRQPFAGIATIGFVSLFYMAGMMLGVLVTNRAHDGRHDERRKINIKDLSKT